MRSTCSTRRPWWSAARSRTSRPGCCRACAASSPPASRTASGVPRTCWSPGSATTAYCAGPPTARCVPCWTTPRRGSVRSQSRACHPLAPRHVPAVEAVAGLDDLVGRVDDRDDVADQRVVVEPRGVGARVLAALDVLDADAAVAGVGRAEDGRVAPVVAVDEGARVAQPHGVRHVRDVVLALAVGVGEADRGAVHPGGLVLLLDDHLAVVGGVALAAGGDRDGVDDLAVADDGHHVGLGVDRGDLRAAHVEADGLVLDAVDAGSALDALEVQVERDVRAGNPVGLRAQVEPLGVEPVADHLLPAAGRHGDAALDGGPVGLGYRVVELHRHRHADADGGAVLGREVADEVRRLGRGGAEAGGGGRGLALRVDGGRGDRVLGAVRQRAGRGPALLVGGQLARHRVPGGLGRHGHRGQGAAGDGDLDRPADLGAGGAGLRGDGDLRGGGVLGRRGVLAGLGEGGRCLRGGRRLRRRRGAGRGFAVRVPTATAVARGEGDAAGDQHGGRGGERAALGDLRVLGRGRSVLGRRHASLQWGWGPPRRHHGLLPSPWKQPPRSKSPFSVVIVAFPTSAPRGAHSGPPSVPGGLRYVDVTIPLPGHGQQRRTLTRSQAVGPGHGSRGGYRCHLAAPPLWRRHWPPSPQGASCSCPPLPHTPPTAR
ncbi:putative Glycine--tRNA ligase [Actinacidiphila cocklensis]|uniref:Glycine--tRNA ligase n=1 Tax=Actinacidiphila cocklensis TaxID=887465 RepID=A0A9W4DSM3_9ACTN|nr:putative Glycine--tRNA ligase [Actinacidiphila cocklensis]